MHNLIPSWEKENTLSFKLLHFRQEQEALFAYHCHKFQITLNHLCINFHLTKKNSTLCCPFNRRIHVLYTHIHTSNSSVFVWPGVTHTAIHNRFYALLLFLELTSPGIPFVIVVVSDLDIGKWLPLTLEMYDLRK